MNAVPMTTATGLGPLPELLEAKESRKAVRKVFAAEGVPLALAGERQHRVPLAALAGLFERAALRAGDPCFGLDVGLHMPPEEYGLWMRYALQAPTLGTSLARIIETLPVHQSGTAMRLAPRPDGRVAWEYRYPASWTGAYAQHTDHIIPVMIRAVRAYRGPDWTPEGVEVGYPAPGHVADLEAATGAPWSFNRPCQAIVLPAADLRAERAAKVPGESRMPATPLIALADVVAASTHAGSQAPVADIVSIVTLRLLEGRSDIDGAASLLGSGRRTIQRRLEAQGLTYRALVTQVRMCRARSLIEGTDASVKRIALELGYTDPAHFTRAFGNYFGFSPSRCRAGKNAG